MKVVKEKWNGTSIRGRATFKVHKKLQLVKKGLTVWNKEKFGCGEGKKKKLELEMNEIDKLQEEREPSRVELLQRKEFANDLNKQIMDSRREFMETKIKL